MSKDTRTKYSLFLEDFDIKELCDKYPNQKVGINVSRIYLQIAKFNQNPCRSEELKILKKAISQASNKYNLDTRYAIMELQDFVFCFGNNLKKMPKFTWSYTHMFKLDD